MDDKEFIQGYVDSGDLLYWEYDNLDENGNVGESRMWNTERLTLVFPSGRKLVLDTACSGCLENTYLILSDGTKTEGN